ncbi:hypothetical protein GZ78_08675 [Endozoicomonas numazuensis]|uniref:Orotidine 5'-phosphate decarboxylase n=1 Tax=Endozoicomonas numazuensis TaxID=1137799 RepID=A0A081NH24_9GAMM|nr:hypothetical protein GZ78_08675 [Endozoicomonas numazuensis]
MSGRSELVVALDVETLDQVKKLVSQLGPEVEYYKIGHQLMTSEGPTAIHYLKEQHKTVFLDLKLHEIPNSVTAAVRSAGRHGVDMVSVHASGGQAMMKAAVAAAEEFSRMKVVALTVVTGLDQRAMNELGWHCSPLEQVIRLTELAVKSGCHGVIASSQEAKKIKGIVPKDFLIITPGIRLAEDDKGDQVRSGTPAIAALNGATHLVVGRPIIQAQDPAKVARRVVTEVEEA